MRAIPNAATQVLFAALGLALAFPVVAARIPDGWKYVQSGGYDTYTRLGLAPGQGVIVFVDEIESAPTPMAFERLVERFAEKLGASIAKPGQAAIEGEGIVRIDILSHPRFGKVFLNSLVMSARGGPAKVYHSVIGADPQLIREQMPEMLALIRSLNGSADGEPVSPQASGKGAEPNNEPETPRFLAAPGDGVPLDRLEGVAYEAYGRLGGAGNYIFVEHAWLLFEDGLAYTGELDVGPADFDYKASRAAEPEKWRPYRLSGKTLKLQTPDGDWSSHDITLQQPADPGETLDGSFKFAKAIGGMGFSASTFSEVIRFTEDGRFESSDYALHTTGTIQGLSGVHGFASRHEQRPQGRYELQGYTLRLRYVDGTETSHLCFTWANSPNRLYIGGKTYAREDE